MSFLNGFMGNAKAQLKALAAAGSTSKRRASQGDAYEPVHLDFISAICAHRQWKTYFNDCLQDTENDEPLDAESVGRGDRSVVGQWLYGEASLRFGKLPSFEKLLDTHSQFHEEAARIVQMHQAGHRTQALALLRSGEYTRLSLKVMGLLGALADESARSEQGSRLMERVAPVAAPGARGRPASA